MFIHVFQLQAIEYLKYFKICPAITYNIINIF